MSFNRKLETQKKLINILLVYKAIEHNLSWIDQEKKTIKSYWDNSQCHCIDFRSSQRDNQSGES